MREPSPPTLSAPIPETASPAMGSVNWIGLKTLYAREVRRFMKVFNQTLLAPVATTLMFVAVFNVALGGMDRMVQGVPYSVFIGPGLMMMAITQNAFSNTSSSIIISKIQGNIVDSLMPPLSAQEVVFGFAMGGVTRGIVIGLLTWAALLAFLPIGLHSLAYVLYHGVMASLLLSLLGLATGIWAEKFDHIASVTNFVVIPLTFLSGTFYSLDSLPLMAQSSALINPFFYMIDGFRYGFIGHADGDLGLGLVIMAALNVGLWMLCVWMVRSGYKLKA